MIYLKTKQIVLPDEIRSGILAIDQGIIQEILPYDAAVPDLLDYGEHILAPGLIDIHNHGYAGWAFTKTSSEEDLKLLSMRLLKEGVTSMLATSSPGYYDLFTTPLQGAEVLGIHAEGPFLNPAQHGAAPPDTPFKKSDLNHLKKMIEASHHQIKMMTVAPEQVGLDILETLRQNKIKIAAGHSNASYEEMMKLDDYIDNITHLGNAMSGLHHRNIGVLGYGLSQDKWVELIADGNHISKPMLEIIFRLKAKDKIILISDTIALGGCRPSKYETAFGDFWIDESGAIINAFGHHSGSSFSLRQDLSYLYRELKISLIDLFRMASTNPALFLGYNDRGELAPGKKADLIVLDEDFELIAAYKDGTCRYQTGDEIVLENPRLQEIIGARELMNFYSIDYEGELQ